MMELCLKRMMDINNSHRRTGRAGSRAGKLLESTGFEDSSYFITMLAMALVSRTTCST